MNAANSKLSRTATIRLPVATLVTIENLGVEVGTTRHALIKLALFDALSTGRMAELARVATAIISPPSG
jgi:hypothetical protein